MTDLSVTAEPASDNDTVWSTCLDNRFWFNETDFISILSLNALLNSMNKNFFNYLTESPLSILSLLPAIINYSVKK